MPQTLTAFVAMLVALQLSLMQQRAALSAQLSMMDSEIESVATGVGLDILDFIETKPFDNGTLYTLIDDTGLLTPLPFETGGLFEDAIVLDDYNQIAPYIYETEFDDLEFQVEMSVRYVDEDNLSQPSILPTFAKEVELTLTHPNMGHAITLSRVYSYP